MTAADLREIYVDRDVTRWGRRRRHAENPDQPGHALCGIRLDPTVRTGDGTCPLCEAVIQGTRDWTGR